MLLGLSLYCNTDGEKGSLLTPILSWPWHKCSLNPEDGRKGSQRI